MCTLRNPSVKNVWILLTRVFKKRNRKRMVSETTRQTIIQGAGLENRYKEEVRLRKEAGDALARKNKELEVMNRLHKEEQGQVQLQTQAMLKKHQKELRLKKETEYGLAIERERIEKVKLQLETLKIENDEKMRLKAEHLEGKYKGELCLRKETETALCEERKELEATKRLLETCKTKQENLTSQITSWQEKYEQESRFRKETEDALSRGKRELATVRRHIISYIREKEAMRVERDNALILVEEITTKQREERRQPPPSFICPISQEVMKDPHLTADGHTYEAEDIKKWFSTGHLTSPMTNVKLPHRNLVPNRALRSAIEEFV